jgi:hypothetical protein
MNAATVGIALAHGAGVTTASADAVLYGGDLRVVPWAVALCRQVRDSIHANLVLAALYNGVGIALAAGGLLHPVAAALLMVVSSFTVSWRALRSVEPGTLCCAPPMTASRTDERFRPNLTQGGTVIRSWWPWICAVFVVIQAPFLIYLGQLGTPASIFVSAALLGLGLLIACFRSRQAELSHVAQMTFAMLGPGNWGMLLGWWADAGFAPVSADCPHCASFSLLGFTHMPWMNLGMLVLGLVPMVLAAREVKGGLGPWSSAALAAVGMVWGMSYGNYVLLKWLGPVVSERFLLSFGGMTLGMLLGMFLCCELGRAIALAWRPS